MTGFTTGNWDGNMSQFYMIDVTRHLDPKTLDSLTHSQILGDLKSLVVTIQ